MIRKNKVKKKKTVGDHILTIVLIVAICIFCYAAFNLYHIYTEYKKGTDEYNSISEMAVTERDPDQVEEIDQPDEQPVAPVSIDFDSLRSINEDVIGWIYMEALPEISYPVVQGEDIIFICTRHMRKIIILRERSLLIMRTKEISAIVIPWCTDTT